MNRLRRLISLLSRFWNLFRKLHIKTHSLYTAPIIAGLVVGSIIIFLHPYFLRIFKDNPIKIESLWAMNPPVSWERGFFDGRGKLISLQNYTIQNTSTDISSITIESLYCPGDRYSYLASYQELEYWESHSDYVYSIEKSFSDSIKK